MPLQPGATLGHYEVLSSLGAGGMGEVYRAKDTKLGREVAIKVLREEVSADPERLARFEREARVLASLNHPHVVTIHAVETQGETRFFVMELIEGRTLEDLLQRGAMPFETFHSHALAIVDAVAAAHGRDVTHRDLKPANVMVSNSGWVKVLDFGLAKDAALVSGSSTSQAPTKDLTQHGTILGTVPYMSPEQLQGKPHAPSSDVFSLGILLYEMATGQRPFEGESQADLISSILRDTPRPPSDFSAELPRDLDTVLGRCLEKDPSLRYGSARELREAVALLREGAGPVDARDLEAEPIAQTEAARVFRSRMVGREEEIGELQAALESAIGGEGSLLTLAGEPGVGKTRLVQELTRLARERGFLSLTGHCSELEGAPPFAPWIEMLETVSAIAPRETLRRLLGDAAPEIAKLLPELHRLFPDLPPPLELPPAEGRRLLFSAFRGFVERSCALQPVLLVLEDLHWSDESSLLLLQYLAPNASQLPLLLIGTYRDVELDVARPLANALRVLVRERVARRLSVRRLPESGTASLLQALSGEEPSAELASRIHHETDGNPFFLEEVVAHLDEEGRLFDEHGRLRRALELEDLEVPESVRLVVSRRLEHLDEKTIDILTTAAVLGRRFDFRLLQEIHEGDVDLLFESLEEAERSRIVVAAKVGRQASYAFAHELIRQTLLSGLTMPRRQRLHLRCATALERLHGDEPERVANALAHHLYQAGGFADEDRTRRFLLEAGRQALAQMAFEEALEHFRLVDDLASPGDREAAELSFSRAQALKGLGRFSEAVAELSKALPYYERIGDAQTVSGICRDGSYFLGWGARPVAGKAMIVRGLQSVTEARHRGPLLAIGGLVAGFAFDRHSAEAWFTEARELARGVDDGALETELLTWEIWDATFFGQTQEVIRREERAIEGLRREGRLFELAMLLGIVAVTHSFTGELDRVDELGADHDRIAERLGGQPGLFHIHQARTVAQWMRTGDLELREQDAWTMKEIVERMKVRWLNEHYNGLALAHLWKGDWEEARRVAIDCHRHNSQIAESPLRESGTGLLLLVEAHLGNQAAAEGLIAEIEPLLPGRTGATSVSGWFNLFRLVESRCLFDDRDEAARLYPLCVEALALGSVVDWCGAQLIERIAGMAASSAGDWPRAQEHYETALHQAHELPFRSEQPEVRRWYARMLLERGRPEDRDRVTELLDEAVRGYQELGMVRHVELAREVWRVT